MFDNIQTVTSGPCSEAGDSNLTFCDISSTDQVCKSLSNFSRPVFELNTTQPDQQNISMPTTQSQNFFFQYVGNASSNATYTPLQGETFIKYGNLLLEDYCEKYAGFSVDFAVNNFGT